LKAFSRISERGTHDSINRLIDKRQKLHNDWRMEKKKESYCPIEDGEYYKSAIQETDAQIEAEHNFMKSIKELM
jgi:hypothetical protein